MLDDDDIPQEGLFTDQWLWGRRAKVWFQREVMLAFPKVEDRLPILQTLEDTMIRYGTARLFYHMEQRVPVTCHWSFMRPVGAKIHEIPGSAPEFAGSSLAPPHPDPCGHSKLPIGSAPIQKVVFGACRPRSRLNIGALPGTCVSKRHPMPPLPTLKCPE
jgi:hypothetical protein